MRLGKRLARLEREARGLPRPDQFDFIQAVPVDWADGRKPGLYRTGAGGSTAGLLVFDPADGEPFVPEGRLAPWGLVVVCGKDKVEPPPEWGE
jgi:hypothetical protein